MPKEINLPKISDLYSDNIEVAYKSDKLNLLLNQQPKKEWIQFNKQANNYAYISIGVIESLLVRIFKKIRVEVLETKTMFNSVAVTVRLHYWNGISDTWEFHDGVGAVELQTKKDSGVLKPDFSNLNRSAVMMALPMAKTYAIKDAAEHLGVLFGRDLNRRDVLEYVENISDESLQKFRDKTKKQEDAPETTIQKEWREKLESIQTGRELTEYLVGIDDETTNDEFHSKQVLICKNRVTSK